MFSFGVSFADATLYGWVDQSHNTVVTTTKADTKKTTNTWGAAQGGTSALGVKGDEDLGDGMKATYLMEIAINAETNDYPDNFNRQSYVGHPLLCGCAYWFTDLGCHHRKWQLYSDRYNNFG